VLQALHHLRLAHVLLTRASLAERRVVAVCSLALPEQQDVHWGALHERRVQRGGVVAEQAARLLCALIVQGRLNHLLRAFQLLHSLARTLLVSQQLVTSIALLICKVRNEALDALNVVHVQVNLLLENGELLVHEDLQVVAASVNLRLQLVHFFPLALLERLALLLGVFLSEELDALRLLILKVLELLAVVLGFLDALVHGDERLTVLEELELGVGLDVGALDGAVQLLVEHVHLVLVLVLQVVHLHDRLVLELVELALPRLVEVLEHLVADVDVLSHLGLLDVLAKFVLVAHDVSFKKSDLAHQILVQRVLVNLAALGRDQEHLLLDRGEDQDLLVLVEHAVVALVEDIDELLGGLEAEQVANLARALVKQKFDVGLIKDSLLAEVGLADRLPHFLALAGGAEHGLGLAHQLLALVEGDVCERAERLLGGSVARRRKRCIRFCLFNVVFFC